VAAQSAPVPALSDNLAINLVNLLVKQGVITQAAADALIAQARRETAEAQARAQTNAPPLPQGSSLGQASAALASAAQAINQAAASLAAAERSQQAAAFLPPGSPGAELTSNLPPPAAGSTRIPYVPEPVKKEIRDDVIRLAKAENWAQPNAIPEWTKHVQISGDLRMRDHNELYSDVNAPDIVNWAAFNANGPIDVNSANGLTNVPFLNTRRTRANQLQIRARLDVRGDPSEFVTTDMRLATGSTNSPVSTTQALGGGLVKKSVWLDRAYIDFHPRPSVGATVGRMPNPFFSTDLVYDTDLNFDGVAVRGVLWGDREFSLFANAGAFLTDYQDVNFPNASTSDQKSPSKRKWLFGSQAGMEWKNEDFSWTFGAAYYSFHGAQGQLSEPCAVYQGVNQCSTDFTRPAFMQKGNTLFLIRDIIPDPNDLVNYKQLQFAGLAFPFHVLNVTSTLDVPVGEGRHLTLTGDFARNLAYHFGDACRYGDLGLPVSNLTGLSPVCFGTGLTGPGFHSGANAFMLRTSFGNPYPDRWGTWNLTAGYKYLAGDSVLDAFTDSDFHLGGTNAKGYFLTAAVGLATNTNVEFRWFSANEVTGPPLSIDVGQIDINTRF
jgi:hypothetical protein